MELRDILFLLSLLGLWWGGYQSGFNRGMKHTEEMLKELQRKYAEDGE